MPVSLCGITQGFDVDCESLRRVSGVKRVWLFNLGDLTSAIDSTGSDYVTNLEFNGYTGLYFYDSKKLSHQFTWTLAVNDNGGASFTQTLALRLFVDSPTEVVSLSDLAVADVGAIIQTNNGEFWIGGVENGLSATEGTGTTGRNLGEDTASTITLTGSERLPYRMLLVGGSATTTLTYLNALTI